MNKNLCETKITNELLQVVIFNFSFDICNFLFCLPPVYPYVVSTYDKNRNPNKFNLIPYRLPPECGYVYAGFFYTGKYGVGESLAYKSSDISELLQIKK